MKTGDLVTWAQVKAILNLDEEQRELVEFLISAASAQAEKFADRFLAARDVELKLDSNGGRELLLPAYPVNHVDRICVDSAHLFAPAEDLTAADYSVKKEAGIIRLFRHEFPCGYEVVLFRGNIGYETVPEDLQQAIIETVAANIRRFTGAGGSIGIKQISANGAITTQYEIDVPLSSRSVFMSYRGARV